MDMLTHRNDLFKRKWPQYIFGHLGFTVPETNFKWKDTCRHSHASSFHSSLAHSHFCHLLFTSCPLKMRHWKCINVCRFIGSHFIQFCIRCLTFSWYDLRLGLNNYQHIMAEHTIPPKKSSEISNSYSRSMNSTLGDVCCKTQPFLFIWGNSCLS